MSEPGKQLNNHTAGGHGSGQNSTAQAIHVDQLRTHVLTVPQQRRSATNNTRNMHISGVRGADCWQVSSMNPNSGTYSAMQGHKPGGHNSMPGHMYQGHSGYSYGSHAAHHMGNHMNSHSATFQVQESILSNGHNSCRGKSHPANHMTHLSHTSSSEASSSGDCSRDGASSSGDGAGSSGDGAGSSGDGSGGVGRQAPVFQVRVFHGDQEMKVCLQCPQAILSLDFQCRSDIPRIKIDVLGLNRSIAMGQE